MIDMYRGVRTFNKLINIDGDAEEVWDNIYKITWKKN